MTSGFRKTIDIAFPESWKGDQDEAQEIRRGANCLRPATGKGGCQGRRALPDGGRKRTDFLRLGKEVPGMGVSEVREFRELRRRAETACGELKPGQAHSPGGVCKKALRPVRKRALVREIGEKFAIGGAHSGVRPIDWREKLRI